MNVLRYYYLKTYNFFKTLRKKMSEEEKENRKRGNKRRGKKEE